MIQTAQSAQVSGNGSQCTSQLAILDDCQSLSTDKAEGANLTLWSNGSDRLLIESPTRLNADITVFDYQGKTIFFESQVVFEGVKSFNISPINTGVYLVSLRTQSRQFTRRVFMP
jgi:hypothetical protein